MLAWLGRLSSRYDLEYEPWRLSSENKSKMLQLTHAPDQAIGFPLRQSVNSLANMNSTHHLVLSGEREPSSVETCMADALGNLLHQGKLIREDAKCAVTLRIYDVFQFNISFDVITIWPLCVLGQQGNCIMSDVSPCIRLLPITTLKTLRSEVVSLCFTERYINSKMRKTAHQERCAHNVE